MKNQMAWDTWFADWLRKSLADADMNVDQFVNGLNDAAPGQRKLYHTDVTRWLSGSLPKLGEAARAKVGPVGDDPQNGTPLGESARPIPV